MNRAQHDKVYGNTGDHRELNTPIVNAGGIDTHYSLIVAGLIKSFEDYRLELSHSAMGISGEAGELCDALKKCVIYGKELDRKNVVEELGDLEFFMQDLRNKLGITRQEVLQANADKLAVRYKGLSYSDSAAQERADKVTKKWFVISPETEPETGEHVELDGPFDSEAEAMRSPKHGGDCVAAWRNVK